MAYKTVAEREREKLREEIQEDLLEQLEEMGATRKHFTDLVSDYLALWDIKNLLIDDIKERGVAIDWQNSATQKGKKRNDSVPELNKTNAQMLKILHQLNIKTSSANEDDEDEF